MSHAAMRMPAASTKCGGAWGMEIAYDGVAGTAVGSNQRPIYNRVADF
jgi:hypothetical protein